MTEENQARFFVTCQFTTIAVLLLTTQWQLFNGVALGLYCGSFSIAIRSFIVMPPGTFNIRPTLKKNAKLVISGPYRYIRHPMYVSVLLASGGLVATSWSVLRFSLLSGLFVVMYCKASLEEKILLKAFSEYQTLKDRTGMFIPWL